MLMKRLLLMCVMALMATAVFAQDPGLPGGDPDTPVPIDGGLLLLLAAGLGYGVRKMVKEQHAWKDDKNQRTP